MEQTFQWSIYTDASKTEQYVVRCDTIEDLVAAIALVKAAIRQQREAQEPPPVPEEHAQPAPDTPQQENICPLHHKMMKLRTAKSGKTWYDHRWKEEGLWYLCNGKQVTTREGSTSAPSS